MKQEINEVSAELEGGVCCRGIVNGKMGYASTQALTPEQASAIVERAMDNAAALADGLVKRGQKLVSGGSDNHPAHVDVPGPGGLTGLCLVFGLAAVLFPDT